MGWPFRTTAPRDAASRAATPRAAAPAASVGASTWLAQQGVTVMAWLLVVLVVGAVAWRWSGQLAIREVQLIGDWTHVQRASLQERVDGVVRGNFLTANVSDLQQAAAQDPWVASVAVAREWPDRLTVTVSEHQPVARWGTRQLMTSEGTLFTPPRMPPQLVLPQLSGPDGETQRVLAQFDEVSRILRRVGLRVSHLSLTDRSSWRLTLDGGVLVLLDDSDVPAKLERFIVLYDRQLAAEFAAIERVDLRYRNGVAVGWRGAAPRA